MDTFCPPVRSRFLHARHMPRQRGKIDEGDLNLPNQQLVSIGSTQADTGKMAIRILV